MTLSISRSSELYNFVFGKKGGWFVEGFPEPRSTRISFGLFGGLLAAMIFIRSFAGFVMGLFEILFRVVPFMINGSYLQGNIRTKAQIVKIEPWPTLYGRRFSPWAALGIIAAWCMYQYVGMREAGEFVLFFIFTTIVFHYIDPNDKSPSEKLAEETGPVMEEKLNLAYYREPKFFPALHLVD